MEPNTQSYSIVHIVLLTLACLMVAALITVLLFTWTQKDKGQVMVEENPISSPTEEVSSAELVADAKSRGQFHFVPENAVASVSLDVTDCEASPDVLSVPLGEELVIQNNGDEEVTLMINAKDYIVPAQGQLTTTTEFGKGAMAYGYSCSLKSRMVGVIVVTAE